jgi:hypothetical protein
MKMHSCKPLIFVFALIFILSALSLAWAQKKPADPIILKLEGAKMAPAPFSHATHADKAKIDCAVCHHKDKNAKEPDSCQKCHLKEAKNGSPAGKDAFHKQCQGCHKESVAKGVTAPTKCNECHKK